MTDESLHLGDVKKMAAQVAGAAAPSQSSISGLSAMAVQAMHNSIAAYGNYVCTTLLFEYKYYTEPGENHWA